MARYDDLRPDGYPIDARVDPAADRWEPNEVHVTRIDVPFLELTWFFIKASLAMALAFSVTSWLWVMIGTGIGSLLAGLLFLLGVPRLLTDTTGTPLGSAPAAVVAPAPPAEVAPAGAPPTDGIDAPAPPPIEIEAAPAPAAPAPVPAAHPKDPDQAATEAAQRAELERIRRERNR